MTTEINTVSDSKIDQLNASQAQTGDIDATAQDFGLALVYTGTDGGRVYTDGMGAYCAIDPIIGTWNNHGGDISVWDDDADEMGVMDTFDALATGKVE